MSKFIYPSRLSKEDQEEILFELSQTLVEIKNPMEAFSFIKDLLSAQEAEMLAKRVKIAEYLLDGHGYDFIQNTMKVSPATIARVNEWLKYSGDGYRLLIDRLKKKRKEAPKKDTSGSSDSPWSDLKRRYPVMFWPQLLLEEVMKGASTRKKKKMRLMIEEMDKKSKLYRRLDETLRQSGNF